MWTVVEATALAGFVRAQTGRPWSEVKRWIETGKIYIAGARELDAGRRLRPGDVVELRMAAPRHREGPEVRIVFEDGHLVVIDKPAGVSSVPYEHKETGTAMDLVRDAWRRQGKAASVVALHVVHRIDKDTSGLLVFAKTKRAEKALAAQLRAHTMERTYVCVAHGDVFSSGLRFASPPARQSLAGPPTRRIESALVPDRGDGLRGSTRFSGQGKRAVTYVRPVERLHGATLCEVKLETGKTHQIRIHLAEAGHPLVGERVYVRDFRGTPIASPRLLLHAATLGFAHPTNGIPVSFAAPLPADFVEVLTTLRAR